MISPMDSLTRAQSTAMEIGYRYLYTDYVTGGFEYDAAMKGLFIGTRIVF